MALTMKRLIGILTLMLSFGTVSASAQDTPLKVVATTSIIADVARNVGGELVDVASLVPPDSDIHAFQPSPDDAVLVAQADVLLVNGAGLELFLGDLLENAAVEPVVVSNGIEMLPFGEHGEEAAGEAHTDEEAQAEGEVVGVLGDEGVCEAEAEHEEEASEADEEEHEHGSCDPHVWTNPQNVVIWTRNIAAAFAAADPANAELYIASADTYIAQLEALDAEVEEILSALPEERRVLVTNHEFFGYFAHRYGLEVVGAVITGGSTLSEPDPQALADLIAIIKEEGVPAIFAEVSANPQLAEIVAAETGINVVTTIYSDSLSEPGSPADTYLNYMRYNAQTIAEALSG
jgi:ABC-type Zn uptake system ZnuABC Zn-binding protein ZnuA